MRDDKKDAREDKAKTIAEYTKEMKGYIEARKKVKDANLQECIGQKKESIQEEVNKLVKYAYNKAQKQSLFLSDIFLQPKDFEKYNSKIKDGKKYLKQKHMTTEQFKTWRTSSLVNFYSEPIIKSLNKLFFRYRYPDSDAELYFDLVAIYLCYMFPKMPPPDFHYYIDTMAIDLSRRNGACITKYKTILNLDLSNILGKRTHKNTTGQSVNKFKKIWEKRINEKPNWLENTNRSERVRYILNQLVTNSKVTVRTGLKYLDEIEKREGKD
jgi:hypothetical protein